MITLAWAAAALALLPLTLAAWQYDLVMQWVTDVVGAAAPAAIVAAVAPARAVAPEPDFAERSAARRAAVLARLGEA